MTEASPKIKKRVLTAMAVAITHDKQVTVEEAEIFRAMSESLDCPVPPVVASDAPNDTNQSELTTNSQFKHLVLNSLICRNGRLKRYGHMRASRDPAAEKRRVARTYVGIECVRSEAGSDVIDIPFARKQGLWRIRLPQQKSKNTRAIPAMTRIGNRRRSPPGSVPIGLRVF